MSPTLKSLRQERWLVILLLAGLLALTILVVADFDTGLPEFPRSGRHSAASALISVDELDGVLSTATFAQLLPPTNAMNPFYTTYFHPPPAKPPTARRINLTYQGFYRTAEGEKRAFVMVGDRLFVGPVGSNVVADLVVADISLQSLTLRNASTQTNTLDFNIGKELEIPAQ
jgi:hypothetical protein